MPGFKGWEVGINPHARVGGFWPKTGTQAARARFSRTHHGGPLDCVEETYLRRGRLGFKGQEVGIDPHASLGDLGQKPKTEPPGLGFRECIAGELGFE